MTKISSLEEYISIIKELYRMEGSVGVYKIYYRGQNNSNYNLLPSLSHKIKEIDDEDHRCHDGHKKFKDRDIAEGDLFRVNGCVVLGGDLAEDQDQNRQDHRYDADHIAAKAVCKCGCKGRS